MTLKGEMMTEMKAKIERQRRQIAAQRWIIGFLALAVGFLAR